MNRESFLRDLISRSDNRKSKIQNLELVGIVALVITFVMCGAVAQAQQSKVPRIGFLSAGSASTYSPRNEAFRQGLRDLGYTQGKTITIEYRFAKGKLERLPDLAAELVRLKVDVIVTSGVPQLLAAKQATSTIPIVGGGAGDLVGAGLVASLARPGGNITGLTSISTDVVGKQLELLKEAVPGLTRVGVLWHGADPYGSRNFKATEVTAQSLGVQVQPLEVRGLEEFESVFKAATQARAHAIMILQTNLTNTHLKRIVELAANSRLATMLGESGLMDSGGLMSYGPNYADMFRRAATYVDKIIKGTKPADLPVEQPTKFEFVINLKTAKKLGLTIPPNVLARADKVIK
jgi:putative tryptophan/tyrosine transport system substrate-binding protein